MDTEEAHDDALLDAERHLFQDRYKPVSLSDITSGILQPPPWLFGPDHLSDVPEGLLRSRTITMLSAEPFTGKTMLMLAMTLSLSTHSPLLGYKPAEAHSVLFLGQDAPTWDYFGSIHKLWLGLGCPSLRSGRAIFFLNRGLRLDGPDVSQLLTDSIRVNGTTVLMIDTLLAFHGKDENSNKEMAELMDLLKSWRDRLGLTIIFSHHTSKPSMAQISGNYRARGASVISGSCDFHLQLASRAGSVSLGIPKRRGSQKRKATDAFTITDLPGGGLTLRVKDSEASAVAGALSFLGVPRTPDELKTHLGTDARFHGVLGYLRRKELVTILPDGRLVAARPSS